MAITYYSRAIDDNGHLYKYDSETEQFFYMDHCWTGIGEWYEREGPFPPEFEIVQIPIERAREICKGNLAGGEQKRKPSRKKCPHCGSRNTASLLYGMPAFDEKLDKDLKEGRVKLGGCCITDCDPKRYCNECGEYFDYPEMPSELI